MQLPPPKDNQFLFLDMNAFFASCEQFKNPELRGKPVGVTPTLSDSGCVIAASYEAKKLGVTTGFRVGDAKVKIPNICIVEANPKFYVDIHNQIADFLVKEISPSVNRLSIDEFAIPMDKKEQWTPNAHATALKIKSALYAMFGESITCSIGIGPNMFLAKLATDLHKPNGLAIVQLHTLTQTYQNFELRDVPGINWGIANRLHSFGIRSVLDFHNASQPFLRQAFGISGAAWWHALRGYPIGSTLPGSAFGFGQSLRKIKSISHSHVLAPNLRTKTKARTVLYKLWIKVVDRLRDKHLGAKQIMMSARGHNERWNFSVTVQATQDVFRVWEAIARDYDELSESFQPTQMYVVVFDLVHHDPCQPTLFSDAAPRVSSAFAAVEKMNTRYGRWTVKPASLLIAGNAAPNRIAFHAPDYAMD